MENQEGLHQVLLKQLRNFGLSYESSPDLRDWQHLLRMISTTYETGCEGVTGNTEAHNARLLETVFDATHEGVVIVSADRRVLYANPAVGDIVGFSPEELVREGEGFLRHPDDTNMCETICYQARKLDRWQDEIPLHTKDGEERRAWLSIDTMRDDQGEIEYFVALLHDVTDIRQSRAQLEHIATHDSLTGLPNRTLFEERLKQALSRASRHGTMGALLLLDLDRFKEVNDGLGHTIGDQLLKESAHRLKNACRFEDTVARLGGDEFILILEDLGNANEAANVADKVLSTFSFPFDIDKMTLQVEASIGITIFSDFGEKAEDLLKQADSAMYAAKAAGGQQYKYYTTEIGLKAEANISVQNELRAAIGADQLQLVYQPQYDASSRKLVGVEALLRWPMPDGSVRMPREFIEIAEVSGLIHPLGLWVFEEACRQAAEWVSAGVDFGRLSVNVSGQQLSDNHFVVEVERLLNEYAIEGRWLEIEVTESTVINQNDIRHRNLQKLHALGIQLAIDDFGTGHSSLANLRHFPLARLKIDQSFIRDLGSDSHGEAIVAATIALAKRLALEVVAEGVEEEGQLDFLRAQECDVVQGYLYSRPIHGSAISEQCALH